MTSLRSLRRRQLLAATALPLIARMPPLDRFFGDCVGAVFPDTLVAA